MSDIPPIGSLTVEQYFHEGPLQVPLNEIYILPDMPYSQKEDDSFRLLLDSIRREGIKEPLRLATREQGGYYLISGYRRCHAAVIAHISTVPAFVEQKTLQECHEAMLGNNLMYMCDADLHRITTGENVDRPAPSIGKSENVVCHIKRFFGIGQTRKKHKGKRPPHGLGR